jgi:hypothetical protein
MLKIKKKTEKVFEQIVLHNSERYLSAEIVEKCFSYSSFINVDKQITGNGFTSAFLKLAPKEKKVNIIIVPNRQVILSKQKSYNNSEIKEVKIGFIYGESDGVYSSDNLDFEVFDVLMFVADSFLNKLELLVSNEHKIDKILIDEAHSCIIQSSFRDKLKGFFNVLKQNFKEQKIVSVTATPLLFQRSEIKIINTITPEKIVNITENQKESFYRLEGIIKKGNKVIVATNNARLIAKLKNKENVLKANFKIGKTLKQNLCELIKIEQDNSSNITIISSAGFEGFDIENGINDVFIFEDRSRDSETFYPANIVQIIGRSRQGVNYIEWCRLTHSKGRTKYAVTSILNKLLSKKISTEKKLTDRNNYLDLQKFSTQSKSHLIPAGVFVLEYDNVKYKLHNEAQRIDNEGLRIYNQFFEDRNIKINYLSEGGNRINFKACSDAKKSEYIKLNRAYINEQNVYNNIFLKVIDFDGLKGFQKHFNKYIRRKYWNVDNIIEVMTTKELITQSILFDKVFFGKYCEDIISTYITHKGTEVSIRSKEYQEKTKALKTSIESVFGRFVLMLTNNKITIPKKEKVWRDYNLLTEVSYVVLDKICSYYNIKVSEIDIRTCNPRILYACVGLDLPNDFYGVGKKNKKQINISLNSLFYDARKRTKTDKKRQKQNQKKKLQKLGFDSRVIDFLLNTFFIKNRDSLFNFCAYHESQMISKIKSEVKNQNLHLEDTSMIRRHDSVIIFNEYAIDNRTLKDFTYLNQRGWFVA